MTKKKSSQNQNETFVPRYEVIRTRSRSKQKKVRARNQRAGDKKAKEHQMDIEPSRQQSTTAQKDNKNRGIHALESKPTTGNRNYNKGGIGQRSKLQEKDSSDSSEDSSPEVIRRKKVQETNSHIKKPVRNVKENKNKQEQKYHGKNDMSSESEDEEIEILQKILKNNLKKRRRDANIEESPQVHRKKMKKIGSTHRDDRMRGRTQTQEKKLSDSSDRSYKKESESPESSRDDNSGRRASSSASGKRRGKDHQKKKSDTTLEIETNKKSLTVRKQEKLARKELEVKLLDELPLSDRCHCNLIKSDLNLELDEKQKESQDIKNIILNAIKVVKERSLEQQIVDYLNGKYPNFAALIVKSMVHKLLNNGQLSPEEVFQEVKDQKQIVCEEKENTKLEKMVPEGEEDEGEDKTPERQQAIQKEPPPTKKKPQLEPETAKELKDTEATAKKQMIGTDQRAGIDVEVRENEEENKLELEIENMQDDKEANNLVIVLSSSKSSAHDSNDERNEENEFVEINEERVVDEPKKGDEEYREVVIEVIDLDQSETLNRCDEEFTNNEQAYPNSHILDSEKNPENQSPKVEKPSNFTFISELEKIRSPTLGSESIESLSKQSSLRDEKYQGESRQIELEIPEQDSVHEICSSVAANIHEKAELKMQIDCCESVQIIEDSIISIKDPSVQNEIENYPLKPLFQNDSNLIDQEFTNETPKKSEQNLNEEEELNESKQEYRGTKNDSQTPLDSKISEEIMVSEVIQQNVTESKEKHGDCIREENQNPRLLAIELPEMMVEEQNNMPLGPKIEAEVQMEVEAEVQADVAPETNIDYLECGQPDTFKKDDNYLIDQTSNIDNGNNLQKDSQPEDQIKDQKADLVGGSELEALSQDKMNEEVHHEIQMVVEEEKTVQVKISDEAQNETSYKGNEGDHPENRKEENWSEKVPQITEEENNYQVPDDQPKELEVTDDINQVSQNQPDNPSNIQMQEGRMIEDVNDHGLLTNAGHREETHEIEGRANEDQMDEEGAVSLEGPNEDNQKEKFAQPISQEQMESLTFGVIEEKVQNIQSNQIEETYYEESFFVPARLNSENHDESNIAAAAETVQSQSLLVRGATFTSQIEEVSFINSNNQTSACDLIIEEFSTPIFQAENRASETQSLQNNEQQEYTEQEPAESSMRDCMDVNQAEAAKEVQSDDRPSESNNIKE